MKAIEIIVSERSCYFLTLEVVGGARLFENFKLAGVVVDTLLEYRGRNKISVYTFVVMPDHIHLLFAPMGRKSASGVVQSLTEAIRERILEMVPPATLSNGIGTQIRSIRSPEEFEAYRRYIEEDPVDEGLATAPESYPFSSRNGRFPCDLEEEPY